MIAYTATTIHDGLIQHPNAALILQDGIVQSITPIADLQPDIECRDLGEGTICPAFVDLQANGGGGVMFNDQTDADGLLQIAQAHAATGTGWLLPTLITDTPDRTRAAIDAAQQVISQGDTCVAGLHLEGPHLSHARCGAHDPALIRTMDADDLTLLCEAAAHLPILLVTVAPESVTPAQIKTLAKAGAIVSLGHTDTDYDQCRAAFAAGSSMVTHLYNAMSPLSHRAPGLVGAALDTPGIAMGLIADGVHVHPAAIRAAQASRPGGLFLVTDAMATLGSPIDRFTLNGREIRRADGRLTLADGTLAGADLTMANAVRFMVNDVGVPVEAAIAMATGRPGALTKINGAGRLESGHPARAAFMPASGAEPRPLF
ncbi:N-acetylglucosamine-6-phosphate deacetylase [Palleronia sp. THAF1]|uniref:N-acetylglucosamine-6-phosphate deacetylase n=1 Tax=Palleronia sp. THAF1 TaxID=2587842 RepID=UPI0020C8302A|nr:N-acetylglucosamine-6-phosphate deacetylase [Palleronia sp. THAF1]